MNINSIKMEVEDEYSNDSRGMKRKREEEDFEYEEEFEPVGWAQNDSDNNFSSLFRLCRQFELSSFFN